MTEDEISDEVFAYFAPEWTPDPAEGWFRVSQLAKRLGSPRNTVSEMLERAIEAGDFERRKRGRETWYRKINKESRGLI